MNSKYIVISVAILISTFGKLSAQDEEIQGEVIDKIASKVDDYIILKSDIERSYLDLVQRGVARSESEKCNILESFITEKMLLAQAEIDSILVLDAEVAIESERRMDYFLQQFGGSQEDLEEYYGKSLDQIQVEIADQLKDQITVQRMQDNLTEDITVTPSEIRKFFNKFPKDSLPYYSEEVIVAQIVKIPEANDEEKQRTVDLLYDLRNQVEIGIDFGVLARKYSEDPGSASNGGLYEHFIGRGEFVAEFEKTAFALDINELSDPVETLFGYHLIQLLDRRGNEFKVRHILVTPKITQADIEVAKNELDSIRSIILSDSVPFEEIAKEYSDDKITGQNGGYFTGVSGSDKISVDRLESDVYFSLENIELGTISEPLEFQMPSGKKAVRVIYYKDRFKPHQANLKDDWQKIQVEALSEKKLNAQEKWYQESQGKFFILIDPEYDACKILLNN